MPSQPENPSRSIRLENTLRDLKEKINHALDEEEIITFTFEMKNVLIGIFIGLWIALGLFAIEIETGFFSWLLGIPKMLWHVL